MGLARVILSCVFLLLCGTGFLGASLAVALGKREAAALPSVSALQVRKSVSASRMYDGSGTEIGRFAEQNRMPVTLDKIPDIVISAFISAEDKNYRHHHGVDPAAVIRAAVANFRNRGSGRRPLGASTITQQVAKNFLTGDDVSLKRKFREMLISLRMDRDIGKNRVLEIYLNEIYLGEGSYGVAAAAEAWFGKSLSSLTYVDAAFLAGLPKAPGAYDPRRRPDAARARRAYVLGRMADDGVITRAQADEGILAPLPSPSGVRLGNAASGWFPEEARRETVVRLGSGALYKGGLTVRTSLDNRLQAAAEEVLRNGLIAYDRRHGWRGALLRIPGIVADNPATWAIPLATVDEQGPVGWRKAVVLGTDRAGNAVIGFTDSTRALLTREGVAWARRAGASGLGPMVRKPDDVVHTGDIILTAEENGRMELKQIPLVQGSLIAMESATGRVLAVAGGFDSAGDSFNRAVQARRQPGSTFKGIIYLAAFEAGYDASSPVLDSPLVLDTGPGQRWKPAGGNAMGLITVRRAVEGSRNLAGVRLLNEVGLDSVSSLAVRLGLYDKPLENYAAGLGAVETTNMKMTAAYAAMGNGGMRVQPGFIDSIADGNGQVIWKRPLPSERVVSNLAAAQIVSVLEGVVRRGTAASALAGIKLPMAGKTGTTNEDHDAWFVGLTPEMAIGVHIGFDRPENMGSTETGGMAAAPVFGEFVKAAAVIHPGRSEFPVPPGARIVKIDPQTGEESKNGIPEIFPPLK